VSNKPKYIHKYALNSYNLESPSYKFGLFQGKRHYRFVCIMHLVCRLKQRKH